MTIFTRLSKLLAKSDSVEIDEKSKIFIASDCHRGDGSWKDDFAHNQNVYYHALRHYYNKGFSYAELGDGDEMWEIRDYENIKKAYPHIFSLFADFHRENKLFMIWGNHDDFKRNKKNCKKHFKTYYDEYSREFKPLMPEIIFRESLSLKYKGNTIFLIHGHQGDWLSDRFSFVGRLLAGYLWGKLQAIGMKDPISSANPTSERNKVENRLVEWASREPIMLIAGHTHRPVLPKPGDKPIYLNTGSCVHPRHITGIEIDSGNISLVKWYINVRENGDLYINRKLLEQSQKLDDYFRHLN